MSTQIKLGSTVRLKSGGPLMTVADVGDYPSIGLAAKCYWFDKNVQHEMVFEIDTIEEDGDN
jgi:uncharacterized protein YodC (DUF2158 family)